MHRLLPADQIAADNAMRIEILADFDNDEMIGSWWHPRWIAFGSDATGIAFGSDATGIAFGSDATGHRLVIDDRPGPGRGKVWEWSRIDGLIWEFAPSLGDFLADVASALEGGTPLHGWRPVAENGDLQWIPV